MNEKKVLLIDDEASLQRSLTLGLLQKGYETESCENGMNGLKALEAFKKNQVPLHYVVVDVRLPDIDGIKLLKVIKFNYPELPVIVITGYGNDATALDAKTEKADAYLEKPFTIDELTKILAEIPQKTATPAAEEMKNAEPDGERSFSAYALLNFSETANLAEAYQELYFMDQVLYCDAIKGDFDLVLLLQAGKMADIQSMVENKIKKMPGVKEVTLLPVDLPQLSESTSSIIGTVDKALGRDKENPEATANPNFSRSASSYVFLEIEKDKLENIYPTLYMNDQVVSCDCIDGKYDIVLLMQGASFAEIDRNILTKIKPLDGVLRIKETPIIKLFEM
ncbi:MAG: response regulator [Candidatus Aminicenantes bacterium]|nr:response regulator [Candidatus Aminicenantes bacterium]